MFFDITTDNLDTMYSYMGGMIGDLMPLILVFIGISIALYIFNSLKK
jgi:hypothetical protein